MGLILDTSVLIAGERRGASLQQVLQQLLETRGDTEIALSAVTVVELTHGVYRARNERDRERRLAFAQQVFRDVPVLPVSFEVAELAGRIEGEQAAIGNVIAFEDLLIGATALAIDFGVATLNVRHFERIPGLAVISA